ncbi:MAG: hydrogenase maturation protein HypF [Miltoncostaeaceae bacterium]|nr:hydrogenase maturation protein HypF [Miltoncostaeaceae bacterium]
MTTRVHVEVDGVVQGVGFRPFVHRLATEMGLAGTVFNHARGVRIEAEGAVEAVDRFLARLTSEAPPLASVESLRAQPATPLGEAGFAIGGSLGGSPAALVTADAATCADCLRELDDPTNRRFRYPFINCTNCGPRFTIVRGVPYDRPNTTMAGFTMCAACQGEYDDPADRRFHAQPNACPDCGPRLSAPLDGTVAYLRAGGIVALKGIGGFHLTCRADDAGAVGRLRSRKRREEKPFALMVADVTAAAALVELGEAEVALLASPARPIVLARRRRWAHVAPQVAPGATELGVMLPYSPLHHLLTRDLDVPLVMTSGNVSDEPIAFRDEDALDRLSGIADAFLLHDRPIHTRTDDSVVRVVRGRPAVLRRSRGYVPAALSLPIQAERPVLACGAELKSTFCLAKGARAWVGHHIGDLRDAGTLASYREGVEHFEHLFAVAPEVIAHDLHPDYLSTAYALEREGLELAGVQHHHAHLAACLAEHGVTERAVGAIYDGAGYGLDGTVWGGEILVGDLHGFERAGHLNTVRLPGGDAAAREGWRMACAWLLAAGEAAPFSLYNERWDAVERLATTGFASPETSSMGRLFDAVSALCGIRTESVYEGQAAIELEAAADLGDRRAYAFGPDLDARPVIGQIVADLRAGLAPGRVSARFHRAVANATAEACAATGLGLAVLSGGVFQNRLLLELTVDALTELGLRVLTPERLPANDGGISFGQAAIAAAAR